MHVPVALSREVRLRAGERCEYCRLHQAGQQATFHIDHILPLARGGDSTAENLALACVSCSLRKGARTSVTDPNTSSEVDLYNPRSESWDVHFEIGPGMQIIGRTAVGRATAAALKMNRALAISIRAEASERGRYP